MWGVAKRLVLYSLLLALFFIAFIAAGLLAARDFDSSELVYFAALTGAFAVGFLCVRALEKKAPAADKIAFAASAAAAITLGALLWRFAGEPFTTADAFPSGDDSTGVWALKDGSAISYRRCGTATEGAAPPLIFLHGGPAIPPRASTVDTVCAIGALGRDVYVYDQIGSGASSRLGDIAAYTVDRHVADLEEIRRILGADKIDVIGVSWGTVLASRYIAAHPGRVAHGVFVSPGILGPRKGDDVEYDYSLSASSDYDGILLPPLRVVVAGALARVNTKVATDFMSEEEATFIMDRLASDPGLEFQGKCKGAAVGGASGARARGANYYANLMTAQDLKRADNPAPQIRRSAPPPILILRGECDYIPRTAIGRYEAAFPEMAVIDVKGEGHSFLGARADVVVPAAACLLTGEPVQSCKDF